MFPSIRLEHSPPVSPGSRHFAKDLWLAKFDIAATWPVWGIMDAVHCDNAKEFHGTMLKRACQNYGIALHFRPVRQPHYGGHIERFLGTFATKISRSPWH